MRINGEWYLCDDGVVRPVIRAEILARDGSWKRALMLVDIGADRTVLAATVASLLGLDGTPGGPGIAGVGGPADSLEYETVLRLTDDKRVSVTFRGQFAAVTDLETLDMSVLGRDITRWFAVIVDQPQSVVCLLSQRHRYRIEFV